MARRLDTAPRCFQTLDRNHDVNDRFCGEATHGSTSHVFNIGDDPMRQQDF
jgi:hypothetical protein